MSGETERDTLQAAVRYALQFPAEVSPTIRKRLQNALRQFEVGGGEPADVEVMGPQEFRDLWPIVRVDLAEVADRAEAAGAKVRVTTARSGNSLGEGPEGLVLLGAEVAK